MKVMLAIGIREVYFRSGCIRFLVLYDGYLYSKETERRKSKWLFKWILLTAILSGMAFAPIPSLSNSRNQEMISMDRILPFPSGLDQPFYKDGFLRCLKNSTGQASATREV